MKFASPGRGDAIFFGWSFIGEGNSKLHSNHKNDRCEKQDRGITEWKVPERENQDERAAPETPITGRVATARASRFPQQHPRGGDETEHRRGADLRPVLQPVIVSEMRLDEASIEGRFMLAFVALELRSGYRSKGDPVATQAPAPEWFCGHQFQGVTGKQESHRSSALLPGLQ